MRTRVIRIGIPMLFASIIFGVVVIFGRARAACELPLEVTKFEDTNDGVCTSDDCSLREAVITANRCEGLNEIELSGGVYTLSLAGPSLDADEDADDLDVTDDLTIRGPLEGVAAVIDGGGIDAVFEIHGAATTVDMRNLTVQNGSDAGIKNAGELTMVEIVVRENTGRFTGAILNTGILHMTDCRVINNRAMEGERTHAVGNMAGEMTIIGGEIAGNTNANEREERRYRSAGIYNNAILQVSGTTIHDNNDATDIGVGISNNSIEVDMGIASVTGVTIYNHTGWAVENLQSGNRIEITESEIRDNVGGAFVNYNQAQAEVLRSTFHGNGVGRVEGTDQCGVVANMGSIQLANSTLSGNLETGPHWISTHCSSFAVLKNLGAALLEFVTISDNEPVVVETRRYSEISSSDWYETVDPETRLKGTLLANNLGPNCQGLAFLSEGHNLVDDATCATRVDLDDQVLSGSDPGLLPLADNGGPTLTHALLASSPAIDGGGPDCPPSDQRGVTRPGGSACDVGAYEDDGVLAGVTPVPLSGEAPEGVPSGPVTCRFGPGTIYSAVLYYDLGEILRILARDPNGAWLEVQRGDNSPCWVFHDLLDVDPEFDVFDLPVGAIPPTPTWTPLPPTPTDKPDSRPQGCWHQGPNDNQPLCYVPCPTNPNPGGACTP